MKLSVDPLTAPQTNTPDAQALMHKMCLKEQSSKSTSNHYLLHNFKNRSYRGCRAKTGKSTSGKPLQGAVNFPSVANTKLKSAKPLKKMLGTATKQVEKLKRVDCIEAERILYIVEQFLSHLLLLGGLQEWLILDQEICQNKN